MKGANAQLHKSCDLGKGWKHGRADSKFARCCSLDSHLIEMLAYKGMIAKRRKPFCELFNLYRKLKKHYNWIKLGTQ